jgi:hypothetical protein
VCAWAQGLAGIGAAAYGAHVLLTDKARARAGAPLNESASHLLTLQFCSRALNAPLATSRARS